MRKKIYISFIVSYLVLAFASLLYPLYILYAFNVKEYYKWIGVIVFFTPFSVFFFYFHRRMWNIYTYIGKAANKINGCEFKAANIFLQKYNDAELVLIYDMLLGIKSEQSIVIYDVLTTKNIVDNNKHKNGEVVFIDKADDGGAGEMRLYREFLLYIPHKLIEKPFMIKHNDILKAVDDYTKIHNKIVMHYIPNSSTYMKINIIPNRKELWVKYFKENGIAYEKRT